MTSCEGTISFYSFPEIEEELSNISFLRQEHQTVVESNSHSPTTNSAKDSEERGSARNKRRRAVDAEVFSMFNPTMLEDLLNAMMRHRDGWPFDRPVGMRRTP